MDNIYERGYARTTCPWCDALKYAKFIGCHQPVNCEFVSVEVECVSNKHRWFEVVPEGIYYEGTTRAMRYITEGR